jgi:hypothetical protein
MTFASARNVARPSLGIGALVWAVLAAEGLAQQPAQTQEAPRPAAVFSGPQVGEKVAGFQVRELLGPRAGTTRDLVAEASGKPLVLFFLHEVTRPSVGLARLVLSYAASLQDQPLEAALVLLSADATQTQQWVERARGALPAGVPITGSLDGNEGPGSYGLNRHVAVTILVVKENRVTANFALIQPSMNVDGPKIAAAIAAVVGRPAPSWDDLQTMARSGRQP